MLKPVSLGLQPPVTSQQCAASNWGSLCHGCFTLCTWENLGSASPGRLAAFFVSYMCTDQRRRYPATGNAHAHLCWEHGPGQPSTKRCGSCPQGREVMLGGRWQQVRPVARPVTWAATSPATARGMNDVGSWAITSLALEMNDASSWPLPALPLPRE